MQGLWIYIRFHALQLSSIVDDDGQSALEAAKPIGVYNALNNQLCQINTESLQRGLKVNMGLAAASALCAELEIVEYDRFVGNFLNPESSIIFAISCHDGEQGYIISSESNMASHQLLKFMDKVKIQRRKNHIPPTKFDDSSYNSKNY